MKYGEMNRHSAAATNCGECGVVLSDDRASPGGIRCGVNAFLGCLSTHYPVQLTVARCCVAANYAWVNRSSMTFLCRQAFAKIFQSTPDDLDMHVVYDVSHNIAKVIRARLAAGVVARMALGLHRDWLVVYVETSCWLAGEDAHLSICPRG